MVARLAGPGTQWKVPGRVKSIYDFVSTGLVDGIFFRVLLLVAPMQSVLLAPVQGSTLAFIMVLISPAVLASADIRYSRLFGFFVGFLLLYTVYMAASLSAYMIDQPDMSRLLVIRDTYLFGELRQTHITQGIYLLAATGFGFLIYTFYQEAFLKYAFIGIILLSFYGYYEFIFYAIFHTNGDFLSNRNFGDLDSAAAGVGRHGIAVTGSLLQQSNLFGSGFMRLKSLTGEPSMYALSVTPFAVYAFGRRWWWIFSILGLSLILSTSTTAVIGLLVGLIYIELRHRPEAVLYVGATMIAVVLLYMTVDTIQYALDTLLFQKLDTISGSYRLQTFFAHTAVPFDGNPIRALFGLGFGTVRSGDMFSNLLANVGIVGLLLYCALILVPCSLLHGGRDSNALVATLLAIFFMEMLTVTEFGYLPPWFMIALGYVRLREQRRPVLLPNRARH